MINKNSLQRFLFQCTGIGYEKGLTKNIRTCHEYVWNNKRAAFLYLTDTNASCIRKILLLSIYA